jgi:xanthine dehydrogenase YagR molybdenum-binding subunit
MGDPIGPQPLPPFQSDAVLHYGQHVAMVVAETREEANAAAALVEVTYERDAPVLSFDDPRASRVSHAWTPDYVAGGCARARWRQPTCRISQTYTTAANTNNPIGLFATGRGVGRRCAHRPRHDAASTWRARHAGDRVRRRSGRVRVLVPFVGGAFGAGLRAWPHVTLAALAARDHEAAGEAGADTRPDVHLGRPSAQHDSAVVHRGEPRRTAHRH